jgi:voltage-gated potassium channel
MFHHEFQYGEIFLISLVLTSATVITHCFGMNWVRLFFKRFWSRSSSSRSKHLVMIGIVGIMMSIHCIEVVIWAGFYYLRGLIPSWLPATHFSIASYTTLGNSNIILPPNWLGLGSFEAMNAMLMFGWSTAILAAVVIKLHSLDD